MNLQTVTTTDVQRNFRKILDELADPVVVARDSRPTAVIMNYSDYVRMSKLEEEKLDREFERLLDQMQAQNKKTKLSDKELDVLIKEALHAAGRD